MFLSTNQARPNTQQQHNVSEVHQYKVPNAAPSSPLHRSAWLQGAIVAGFSILLSATVSAQPNTPPSFLVIGAGTVPEFEGADDYQAVPLIVARHQIGSALLEVAGTQARLGILQHERFSAGPVLGFTGARDDEVDDDDYADSRFGVSSQEALTTGLAAYDPSGGLKEASLSVRSIMSFSPRYGIFTRLAYTRLLGDAADSPIVDQAGSIDQAFAGAGLFVSFGR